jgi:peptide methionine sulfoxide reductase MsrA
MRKQWKKERKQFFMGIIKASKLIYDYIRRDEDDHVEEVKRAIDDLTLDINQILWLFWGTTAPESLPLPNR